LQFSVCSSQFAVCIMGTGNWELFFNQKYNLMNAKMVPTNERRDLISERGEKVSEGEKAIGNKFKNLN